MKLNFKIFPILILAGIMITTGCDKDDDPVAEMDEKNIVEVAQEAGQFSMLLHAAQRAGLADFLSTENSITVFAPTDDAFAALLAGLGLSSLEEIDATTLAGILAYHVVGDIAYSSALSSGVVPSLNTSAPGNVPLSLLFSVGEDVMVNKSKVTTADIEASNGLIHIIDKVLLPPSVVDVATFSEDFSALVSAVVKAGLVDALSAEGPFTVFAPTNAAFDELFAALGISGIDELTAEQLTPILTYHVVSGNVRSTDLSAGEVGTLNPGSNLTVDLSSGVMINESAVIAADIQGANGVVHVIDKVLLPE